MNPFVQEDNKTMEPTCADDGDDDNDDEGLRSDQIRSFQHHGKRDSTSTCVRDPPVALPSTVPDLQIRFGPLE